MFETVARLESVSRASALINLSQPAVTQAITNFELSEVEVALAHGAVIPPAQRDAAGKLIFAVATGVRASILTNEGGIDPDLIPTGELTQNLCSPWQWDFADCYCYY